MMKQQIFWDEIDGKTVKGCCFSISADSILISFEDGTFVGLKAGYDESSRNSFMENEVHFDIMNYSKKSLEALGIVTHEEYWQIRNQKGEEEREKIKQAEIAELARLKDKYEK